LKNISMARDYADRAERIMDEAENALSTGDAAISVRRTQETLELAAKAVLRRLAIEYPHEHDVSEALEAVSRRLPDYLKTRVDEIKAMLVELAKVRGPAFYGYETEGIPASQAFTREYAAETLAKTKPLVELCVRFASE
jgi:HEPN domain-containing protein